MDQQNKKKQLFISGSDTISVFDNKFLEWITTTNHLVPFIIFIPVVIYFIGETIYFSYNGQLDQPMYIIPLLFGAFILWTLMEYTIHRFFFHSNPKSDFGKKMLYVIHGAHHDYPNDSKRLVVPPIISLTGGVLLYWLAFTLFGRVYAAPFFGALVLAYLLYDWFHYVSHHVKIKNKYVRMLIKHHLEHHYQDPKNGYGFTTKVWDQLFNTMFKK